jgi:hydrogenase expression/formation protein HypC
MCLGVPGKILEITEEEPLRSGRVAFGGVVKKVVLAYVPDAKVGDFVIVHVGFAISIIDEEEAARVFSYLREIGDLDALGEIPEVPGSEAVPGQPGLPPQEAPSQGGGET